MPAMKTEITDIVLPREISSLNLEADFIPIRINPHTILPIAERFGIRVTAPDSTSTLMLGNDFARLPREANLSIAGSNNLVVMEENTAFHGTITLGSGCIAVIQGGQHALRLDATLYDGGSLFWGRGARTYGCRVWAHGGKRIVVGDDCLFSEDVRIRTSDHHSIIDLADGTQLNWPADVVIGRHVWVGPGVSIHKHVSVGTGAIIGAGAMVLRDIPARELWAGVPAKAIRRNVSWVDPHPADADAVRDLLGGYGGAVV